jgi:hypothetical protein
LLPFATGEAGCDYGISDARKHIKILEEDIIGYYRNILYKYTRLEGIYFTALNIYSEFWLRLTLLSGSHFLIEQRSYHCLFQDSQSFTF